MEARRFASVGQVRGSMSSANVANPAAFQRANYIRVLESYQSAYI
jgi:dihydroorotate dehydrogenase (fumarate)